MVFDRLLFGTADIPHLTSKRKDIIEGMEQIKKLGLDCMQVELGHGTRIKEGLAEKIKRASLDLNIPLVGHGPANLNLNAMDQDKVETTLEKIVQMAKTAELCGASVLTFPTANYMKDFPEEVYELVEKNLKMVQEKLLLLEITTHLGVELTGKSTQFGSLEEILSLCKKIKSCQPCLDFSQLYARTGRYNSLKEFTEVLKLIQQELGEGALKRICVRISGMSLNAKGDSLAVNLEESTFKWQDLILSLMENRCHGFIICSSPNLETDAKKLQDYYKSL